MEGAQTEGLSVEWRLSGISSAIGQSGLTA